MTRRSILEYAEAVRERYLRSSKKKKTEMLNEFVATTGLHRKAVIRLLNRRSRSSVRKRRGRPRLYGLEAMAALKVVWEATDRLCSKRFHPFLPELAGILKRKGELSLSEETEAQLCQMSPSTIDRILRRWRGKGLRRSLSTTKPGTLLKNAIPVRTFSEWNKSSPAFLRLTLLPIVETAQRDFISPHCLRLTWQRVGVSLLQCGGKGKSVLVVPFTMCGSDFPCLCLV